MERFGIYVHVPYCLKQCAYCDFFTMPMTRERSEHFSPYLTALFQDMDESLPYFADRPISTIFFGGGTPSLLKPSELEQILLQLQEHCRFTEDVEITLEINPESIDRDKARDFLRAGVNRASMGVQSLYRDDLKRLGRLHAPESSVAAYNALRKAGFDNISLDFIYGRPSQTVTSWEQELREIREWQTEHLSLYELILEPGTAMTRAVNAGTLTLPSEEERLEMYRLCRSSLLEDGWEWYETSNYCRPGFEARHNLENWLGAEYLGLGPGAHSFRASPGFGARRANPRNLPKYFSQPGGAEWKERNSHEMRTEALLNGLRVRTGVDLARVTASWGVDLSVELAERTQPLQDAGYLEVTGSHWRLTERGAELSDAVLSYLLPSLETNAD
jgi:oxygen-independent coproporphyrinogen-3 oxidase